MTLIALTGPLNSNLTKQCDVLVHVWVKLAYGQWHAKTCLWAYWTTPRSRSACASMQSDQGLHCQLTGIIRYYRRYEHRAKARMILCTCAGWWEVVHFANVWRHFFTWCSPYHLHFYFCVLTHYINNICITCLFGTACMCLSCLAALKIWKLNWTCLFLKNIYCLRYNEQLLEVISKQQIIYIYLFLISWLDILHVHKSPFW